MCLNTLKCLQILSGTFENTQNEKLLFEHFEDTQNHKTLCLIKIPRIQLHLNVEELKIFPWISGVIIFFRQFQYLEYIIGARLTWAGVACWYLEYLPSAGTVRQIRQDFYMKLSQYNFDLSVFKIYVIFCRIFALHLFFCSKTGHIASHSLLSTLLIIKLLSVCIIKHRM